LNHLEKFSYNCKILINFKSNLFQVIRLSKKKIKLFDKNGFSKNGIHGATGTKHDLHGFNKKGIHRATGTKFNKGGFDKDGYDGEGYDCDGYNGEGYDKKGFRRDGLDENRRDKNGKYHPRESTMHDDYAH
jgi:hypothetical protein